MVEKRAKETLLERTTLEESEVKEVREFSFLKERKTLPPKLHEGTALLGFG